MRQELIQQELAPSGGGLNNTGPLNLAASQQTNKVSDTNGSAQGGGTFNSTGGAPSTAEAPWP